MIWVLIKSNDNKIYKNVIGKQDGKTDYIACLWDNPVS